MKKMFFIVLSLISSIAMASSDFCTDQLDLVSRIKNNNLTLCEALTFEANDINPKDFVEKSTHVNIFCENKQKLEHKTQYVGIFEHAQFLNEKNWNDQLELARASYELSKIDINSPEFSKKVNKLFKNNKMMEKK